LVPSAREQVRFRERPERQDVTTVRGVHELDIAPLIFAREDQRISRSDDQPVGITVPGSLTRIDE